MAKKVKKTISKSAKRGKKNHFCAIVIVLLVVISVVLAGLLYRLNVLPSGYIVIVVCALIVVVGLLSIGVLIKKSRIVCSILSLIYMLLCLFGIFYEVHTIGFLGNIGKNDNISTENYKLIVLKDSSYHDIKDLKNKNIGILSTKEEGYSKALSTLESKFDFKSKTYEDVISLAEALINKSVEGILIDEAGNELLKENYQGYDKVIKILYEFSINVKQEDITKKKDVTKEAFTIYISGIDTYGKVTSVSRSDVNILVTVNPKTNKIYMVHVPRDYYVTLAGKNAKDKLTHSGIYGIDCSVKTLENLFDTEINYYVRLNFTSLINVVNAIGGVDVVSKYSFDTGIYDEHMTETYHFNRGKNHLNGSQALSFVRERHAFNDGDRVRGENQMLVLSAIINKVISPSILNNYTKLLNSLSNAFVTNLTEEEITKLVRKQLDNNKSWSIEQTELNGTAAYQYTFSYPRQKLYTMVPDEELINNAKEKIDEVINEK